MLKIIDNVNVSWFGIDDFTDDEARNYIDYVLTNAPCNAPLENIVVKMCNDGKVDVNYQYHDRPFERIRRITGKRIAVHSQAV